MFQNPQGSQLLIEPLVGYRCFQVRAEDGTVFSMNNQHPWPTEGLQATCIYHMRAPAQHCSCGVYAAKTMQWLVKQPQYWPQDKDYDPKSPYKRPAVVAGVHLWGLVQAYTEGYRAEWAKPVVIYYTPKLYEIAKKVAEKYGAITEPRPGVVHEPDEDDLQQMKQLQLMKQRAADARREAYIKKRERTQAILEEGIKRGIVDANGNPTAKGKLLINRKGV